MMDVSGFMIDMDGTIYKGGKPIPGAKEFISLLNSKKIPFVFLTNNSSHARNYYFEKVKALGFDVTLDNILTSTVATTRFLLNNRPDSKVFVLATPAVKQEIIDAGINVIDEDADTVLLTFDTTIEYDRINKAYNLLKNGAEFIATHPDDLCPTENGYDIDIGPFIRLFETMTDTKAIVIGKPNRLMLEMAASEMGVDPKRTVMVGDRMYTDIRMAVDTEIQSVLVLTGETKKEDLTDSKISPTFVVESISGIEKLL